MKKLLLLIGLFGVFSLYGVDINNTKTDVNSSIGEDKIISGDMPVKKQFISPDNKEFNQKIKNMKKIGSVSEG